PADRPSVGVGSHFGIQGDFEITVRYEILKEPEPADSGVQTRFAIAVTLDKPNSKQDQAAINYRIIPSKGSQYFAWLSTKDEVTGKPQPLMKGVPAKAKTGQLRMVRSGKIVSFFTAEGNDSEFTLVEKLPFGAENLRVVSLVAQTGGPKAEIDVR